MITNHNILYNANDISFIVKNCAHWMNTMLAKHPDSIICPIMQSSYYFCSHVFQQLTAEPLVDSFGINFYAEDGTEDGLYMYKGPSVDVYSNKTVFVMDVICNTGTTMDTASRFLKQMGAKNVYTVSLLVRQFSVHKPSWKGFNISDDEVYGYGMDLGHKYRTLPYIAYK